MPPIASSSRTILVVSLQDDQSSVVHALLSARGHFVHFCTETEEALGCCDPGKVDLVVIDERVRFEQRELLLREMKCRGLADRVLLSRSFSDRDPEERLPGMEWAENLAWEIERAAYSSGHDSSTNVQEGTGDGRGSTNARRSIAFQSTPLIGRSAVMKRLFRTIDRIAPLDTNVLITGPTGTGKELVARAIHDLSHRRNAPFVDLNCSAIPETLFEAEFFGHQRGTFTGAYETRRGLFESATGGTLFLDEVDTLTIGAQAKLLRVLQERQLRRVGGRDKISVDVRIIASSNSNLKGRISDGTFRSDLYFRLRVIPLHLPPLKDRDQDIMLLVEHFLRKYAERTGEPQRHFSYEAMKVLQSYPWHGNVRELENVVEYALALGGHTLGVQDLPPDMFDEETDGSMPTKEPVGSILSLAELERRHILSTFDRLGRHQIKTAVALGIDRRTLYRKLRQYDIEVQMQSA